MPAIFRINGTTLSLSLYQGGDSLILMRLNSYNIPFQIWQSIAAALLISGLGEIAIGLAHATAHGIWQPMIIGLLSSMTLLWLGELGLLPHLHLSNNPQEHSQEAAPESREATTQLADRLRVPVKELSKGINQISGKNVSRFINWRRITHACELLRQGHSVTSAMFDSGFQTKSDFNSEFLRLKSCAPQVWLGRHSPNWRRPFQFIPPSLFPQD